MAQQQKPELGDWARGRRVIHNDYTDTTPDEGVVVGVPRRNGEPYQVLNPFDGNQPFQMHSDDAQAVPDRELSENNRAFKEWVKDGLKGNFEQNKA